MPETPFTDQPPSVQEGVEPTRADAATDFDPDLCPWCGETGFDLRGLAQHVWQRCEVVERLAEENADDLRRWHQKNYEDHQRRKAEAARESDEGPTNA